jgi:hydrogenase maturation protein HypF
MPSPRRVPRDLEPFSATDLATCTDCLNELLDSGNRRYRYPFIDCARCGPRFTVTQRWPLLRATTTMAPFPMCARCRLEYGDEGGRRFQAELNACPACGPVLSLQLNLPVLDLLPAGCDPVEQAQSMLAQGCIVAVKGWGGYHLACDATNAAAVRHLRESKRCRERPLAVLAADRAAVEEICEVTPSEWDLLEARRRPIVLLRRRSKTPLADNVAPGLNRLGVMLPHAPLHTLLFAAQKCVTDVRRLLAVTSANAGAEPVTYREEDVAARLAPLADAFLRHGRDIQVPCDDSIVRSVAGAPVLLRRSRGYVPEPLSLEISFQQPLLAVGGNSNSTICLAKDNHVFLSQHIGNLDNAEACRVFQTTADHFRRLFGVEPAVVAHDMEPDCAGARYALELRDTIPVAVQHHHAHIAAVLVECNLKGPVIGVVFDKGGYGPDGTLWGGEFLITDLAGFERAVYLQPVPIPDGAQALLQPWRVAAAWLYHAYGEQWLEWPLAFSQAVDRQAWGVLHHLIEHRSDCPYSSSAAHLFDAVAALTGIRQRVSYEGQVAMELESLLDPDINGAYPFSLHGEILDPVAALADLVSDLLARVPTPVVVARFCNGMAQAVTAVCRRLRQERGLNQVALSGDVWQNGFLLEQTLAQLESRDFEVYTNRFVPLNDGGLCLGQAGIAAAQQYRAGIGR